jgi:hypothetical protein
MRAENLALALALVALACEAPGGTAPAAASSAPVAANAGVRPSARASAPPAPRRAPKRPSLARLALDSEGRLIGELGPGRRAVRVVLASREQPLAPRAPAAYFAIAEIVAPGLAPKTTLLDLPLGDLVRAAGDARTQRVIERARVLGTGTVWVALIELPAARSTAVDLGDLREGRLAWSWESKLVTKDGPPAELARLLASYQTLLAVDHLTANLARREVQHDAERQVLVPVEANDVFSPRGVDDAVGEASARLHRHLTFSARLVDRLEKLDRASAERALSRSPDRSLLVTPKQLDELLERKSSLSKLIETRIRQRGRERALALP